MNSVSLIKSLLINAACQNATAVCANTAGTEPPIDPRHVLSVRCPMGFVEPTHQVEAALFKHHDACPIGKQAVGQQNVAG